MGFSRAILRAGVCPLILGGLLILLSGNWVQAQSTFDLEPPTQSETETPEILMSPDPNKIPTYTFVVASLNDEGALEIVRSYPKQEPLNAAAVGNGIPETVTVVQNFTVQVPYTEMQNGVPIQKIRTETRTREVPVTRIRKRTAAEQEEFDRKNRKSEGQSADDAQPKIKQVSVPYFVEVPESVEVDGKIVTTLRRVKRMRVTSVQRGKTKTTSIVGKETLDLDDCKFFDVQGRLLERDVVHERLVERAPAILIKDPSAITPYFEQLMNPNAMFIIFSED